jgi:ABC-type oligopeptide transport system ATPase subunit
MAAAAQIGHPKEVFIHRHFDLVAHIHRKSEIATVEKIISNSDHIFTEYLAHQIFNPSAKERPGKAGSQSTVDPQRKNNYAMNIFGPMTVR